MSKCAKCCKECEEDPDENYETYIGKGLGTIGSALICGYLMYLTKGEHGIGWFIASLVLIW